MDEQTKPYVYVNHKNGSLTLDFLKKQLQNDEQALFMFAGLFPQNPEYSIGILISSKGIAYVGVYMKHLHLKTELLITSFAKNLLGIINENQGTFITFKEEVEVIKKFNKEIETRKLRKIIVGDDKNIREVNDNLNRILVLLNENTTVNKIKGNEVVNPIKNKYDEITTKLETGQTLEVSKICSIKLTDTYLSIIRPNTLEFRSNSCEGENRIYYRNIIGFRKESYDYIRVLVAGVNNEKSGGVMNLKLFYDPFSIHLRSEFSDEYVKNLILSIINKKMSGEKKEVSNNNLSKYDELKKVKELYDLGILSLEEYNAEKEKLLK